MKKELEKELETEGTEETEEEVEGCETDEEETEEDEEEVKENLKSYIQSETASASEKAIDEMLDKKSEELVKKFFAGVEVNREKAIKSARKQVKNLTEQEQVKSWFTALMAKDTATLKRMEKDYLNTGDDEKGGYLVPPALLAEVNRFTEEYGVARRDMRYLPFSGAGNERKIPTLASSVSTFWVNEGGSKPSTVPEFALVTQTLKKIAAICPMTEEMLEDPAIDIIRLLGELFGEAVAYEEDRVFLAGDTDDGDPFNGVINAAGVVPVVIGSVNPSAADFGNELADAMNRALYAVPTQVRNKGKFYIHSDYMGILQRVKDPEGRYLIQRPVGDSNVSTIWNRPIELVDVLPDEDASGEDTPIAFYTDLNKTCVYGDKGGLRVKYLTEATISSAGESPSSINLAEEDMVALRIVKRTGYVPLLPSGIAVLTLGDES